MFIPLHDDTPLRVIRFQWMTAAIAALNVAVFLFTRLSGDQFELAALMTFGVIPVEATFRDVAQPGLLPVPEPLTFVTYQFVHGGWLHLITNLLFLWVFADNVEDAFGPWSFLLFYLLCGVAAGLVHALVAPTSDAPLVGASGAVAGVLASYMMLYPKARIWILLFMRLPLRFQAIYVLGGWIVLQVVSLFLVPPEEVAVAWWAHIGGFVTGLLLTTLLRSRLMLGPAP